MRSLAALFLALTLGACVDASAPVTEEGPRAVPVAPSVTGVGKINFAAVRARVEPVAEQMCRQRAAPGTNCNLKVYLIDDPKAEPNAFQTRDDYGYPQIVFSTTLLAMMRNDEEFAFVFSHEAAHHILGHIDATYERAISGALVGGVLASLGGAETADIQTAQKVGAALAVRGYSKEFELQADSLGTQIAYAAGFNPLIGADFFNRLPDPRNAFLSTHPRNAQRIATVRQTMAALQ